MSARLPRLPRVPRLALAALIATACAGATPPPPLPLAPPTVAPAAPPAAPAETPDAPFRAQPPAKGDVVRAFAPPEVRELTLKNGIRVLFAPHPVGTVSVTLVVKAGQGDVPRARPGALSFLGAMLEQGTKTRSALKISDELEAIGAHDHAAFGWDSGAIGVDVLREHLDKALDLMADVVQNPTFPKDELERLRARRLANVQSEKNSPSSMSRNAQAAALYGRAHPYGHSLTGRMADIKAVTVAELSQLHRELFVPSLVTLVVAGGVTEDTLVPSLERAFGSMRGPKRQRAAVPRLAAPKGASDETRLVVVDKPGAAQSQISVTQVGVAADVADRDALTVMNAILGGMFSSRINLNLREKHAYTYGARTGFAMRRGAGPFDAGAAVVTDKTVPALREVFVELEAMRTAEVTEAELAGAKDALIQGLPARFETARDVVNALTDVVVYDWPKDEYATRVARLSKVTAADVKRVAVHYLTPRKMRVIVVGDHARLKDDLESMHLGAAALRDAYGDPPATATSATPAAKPAPGKPAPTTPTPAKPAPGRSAPAKPAH
ncbi:MAG: insulinase family protein [Myxococcales bacterium]|nr:insulinase family protein [Myxococcales bacterium]